MNYYTGNGNIRIKRDSDSFVNYTEYELRVTFRLQYKFVAKYGNINPLHVIRFCLFFLIRVNGYFLFSFNFRMLFIRHSAGRVCMWRGYSNMYKPLYYGQPKFNTTSHQLDHIKCGIRCTVKV